MFQNVSGATQCAVCPVGFSNRRRESTACEMCAAGRFGDSCEDCPGGWFRPVDSTTAWKCEVCPAGFFQGDRGTTFCFECEAGTYSQEPGSPACQVCGAGLYFPSKRGSSASDCRACQVDGTVPNRARTECVRPDTPVQSMPPPGEVRVQSRDLLTMRILWTAPPGASRVLNLSYQIQMSTNPDFQGRPRTWEQPPGKALAADLRMNITLAIQAYFTRVRAFEGETRTGGEWSTPTGAWTTAEDCGVAEFRVTGGTDPGAWGCRACPAGAQCTATSTDRNLVPRRGYWRVPWAADRNTFGKCPYADACVGAGHTDFGAGGTEGCLAGTEDVLCAVCSEGYNREAGECRECTSGALAIRIGVIGGVLARRGGSDLHLAPPHPAAAPQVPLALAGPPAHHHH